MYRSMAGARPADPSLPDRPPRELLALVDQFHHDLARGADPPPEREHPLDRVADLLIRTQHNPAVVNTIQADWQRQPQLAALGLVAQPAVQPSADQMQLRFAHRPL